MKPGQTVEIFIQRALMGLPTSDPAVQAATPVAPLPNRDSHGRDTTGWITVNGGLRPHP